MKNSKEASFKASLKYIRVGTSCCGDDWAQTESSRYDLERLGCMPARNLEDANLLVIQGTLNEKLQNEVEAYYAKMQAPKYVLAVGTCACGGGLFPLAKNEKLPITIYVTGCPPRPEAIMNGILSLRGVQT
jgi:NADH:ubiquinone oxidoreductase subunit B-like Fe-S oxidoreductase